MEKSSNHDTSIDIDPNGHIDGLGVNFETLEPTVGMEFDSEEEIRSFYKRYASTKSFAWKIKN